MAGLHHTTGSPVQFTAAWALGLRTVAIAVLISLVASLIAVLRITGVQPKAALLYGIEDGMEQPSVDDGGRTGARSRPRWRCARKP